ncbi:MAG TPA: hypothetical protein VN763_03940 [Saprospiraceae bacterium]|nr:hypothetical protein [Saprospiraceae bacterium]
MSGTKTFTGITPAIWKCVKSSSTKEYGTVFAPPEASTGTATTVVKSLGITFTVILKFDYNAAKEQVTYVIKDRPLFVVGDNDIWNGIQKTIDGCKKR